MVSSMVERVAQALHAAWWREQDGLGEPDWNGLVEHGKDFFRTFARAAIEAMQEPTEAMLDGARDWGIKKYGVGPGNDAAGGCWNAMITAALDGEKP